MRETIRDTFALWSYRFNRWAFRWVVDSDGDIGVCICNGLVTLIKYRQGTIIIWRIGGRLPSAGKYQGRITPPSDD